MTWININNYWLDKPLTADKSGFSKWGLGRRGNRTYFLKEFLSPTYPADAALFTEEQREKRTELCHAFEEDKRELYQAIRDCNDGNLVEIEQFFRLGAKYYMSTRALICPLLTLEDVVTRPFRDRLRLCCAVAHAIAGLHSKQIVHADIKPDNILLLATDIPKAKIIDFDCSFFEYRAPKGEDDLHGDTVYLSPEACLFMIGEEAKLTCKMDVFALGILFCQYLAGQLPGFEDPDCDYIHEAVLEDVPLDLSMIGNSTCRGLIGWMLKKDPEERPSAERVFRELNTLFLDMMGREPVHSRGEEPERAGESVPEPDPGRGILYYDPYGPRDSEFHLPGDLL